ncbi:MAG: molybdopterin-synthase adenylyltransferase MoeB [Thermoplasmata archaeon]
MSHIEGGNGGSMAKVQIRIPTPLRSFTAGLAQIPVEGSTVGDGIHQLVAQHPGLERHLFTPDGKLRSFVTVYLNEEDVRYLERDATPLKDGDTVSLVPAIAGGSADSRRRATTERAADPEAAAPAGADVPLTADERLRYSRHLLLPEVGVAGQKALRASKVLVVGAGGLGAPTTLYLAAAGIGEIGLIDFDTVELSNLQRQILYSTSDVGRPKLEAARERLTSLNPGVTVVSYEERLTSLNALEILGRYDVIVDGTDNFPTRYLVNDACVLLGKPNIYGSIYRFEGQASVFDATRGPCYRCLYPEPPPPGLVPSCAEGGVLGVLPGMIGVVQAIETIKALLHIGDPLVGRLLLFDALALRFRELKLLKNPDCVICGTHPTQTELIDYAAFCGVPAPGAAEVPSGLPEITPEELKARIDAGDAPFLLDVREPQEWEIGHLPGATLIPRQQLPDRVTELARAREVVVYCKSGNRSSQATRFLIELGFNNVRNLTGGIDAWSRRIDPSVPRY